LVDYFPECVAAEKDLVAGISVNVRQLPSDSWIIGDSIEYPNNDNSNVL
jgi:hypothetical protein